MAGPRDAARTVLDEHPDGDPIPFVDASRAWVLALPGTIRGDFGRDWGHEVQENIVHGSDSAQSSVREIGIWFPELG